MSASSALAAPDRFLFTGLQVTAAVMAAVMAGVVWALRNPRRDVVEPDEMPFDFVLGLCRPYLGDMVAACTDWTPLQGRSWLFHEDLDRSDPWPLCNFLVT